MSKHTPGPWAVRETLERHRRNFFPHEIHDAHGARVAITGAYPSESREEANARLIANAPELLEFTRAVAEYDEYRDDDEDPREILSRLEARARAAIAKAEGK